MSRVHAVVARDKLILNNCITIEVFYFKTESNGRVDIS